MKRLRLCSIALHFCWIYFSLLLRDKATVNTLYALSASTLAVFLCGLLLFIEGILTPIVC